MKYEIDTKIAPTLADAYFYRGLLLEDMKRYEEAVEDYSRAIELNPNHEKALFYRGMHYDCTGREELALQDFNKVLELNPIHLGTLMCRADLLIDLEKYPEALLDCCKLLKQCPKGADNHYRLGMVLSGMGFVKAGRECLVRAAELDPSYRRDLEIYTREMKQNENTL